MGEQPRPVDDELERALATMRAGFLSGSEQITAGITALDRHLETAPASEEREAIWAAVSRLASAQELLIGKVAQLPESSWDSFKVLVSAVKIQQTVLDQVSALVQEHVLPGQLEGLSSPPSFLSSPGRRDELSSSGRRDQPAPSDAPVFRPHGSYLPHDVFPPRDSVFPPDRPHSTPPPLPARDDIHRGSDAFPPGKGPQGDNAYLGGGTFPGDDDARLGRNRLPGDGGRRGGSLLPGDGPPLPPALPVSFGAPDDPDPQIGLQAVAPTRPGTGFRALDDAGLAHDTDRPREMRRHQVYDDDLEDDAERVSWFARMRERTAGFRGLAAMIVVGVILGAFPRDRMQDLVSQVIETLGSPGITSGPDEPQRSRPEVAVAPRSSERVPAGPEAESDAAPAPTTRASVVTTPTASAEAEERFVPVVFTHKDQAAVVRALSDLKRQHPRLLVGLQGEVQPVDLGDKGVWHRLVLLPAGPHPQAARVCDRLAAEGYARCLVTTY